MTTRIFIKFKGPEHEVATVADVVPNRGDVVTFYDHPGEFKVVKVLYAVKEDRQVPEVHVFVEKSQ